MASPGTKGALRFLAAALLAPAAILGTVAYVQRDLMAVRWHLRSAARGAEWDQRTWQWLFDRRELAAPAALRHFRVPGEAAGAGRALVRLFEPHSHDPDLAYLGLSTLAKLRQMHEELPPAGRAAAAAFAGRFLEWHLRDRFSGVPTLLDSAGVIVRLALDDADPAVREAALAMVPALWKVPAVLGPAASLDGAWRLRLCKAIATNLGSDNPEMRRKAALALVGAPAREHDPALLQLLLAEQEPEATRRAAFAALASGDDDRLGQRHRDRALEYLHDREPAVRHAARQLVRNIRDEAEAAWLVQATDPDAKTRAAAAPAVRELALRGDPAFALLGLKRLAGDRDPLVRLAAAEAAGRWPNRTAAEVAKQLVRDPDTAVSAAAARELQRISAGPVPDRK